MHSENFAVTEFSEVGLPEFLISAKFVSRFWAPKLWATIDRAAYSSEKLSQGAQTALGLVMRIVYDLHFSVLAHLRIELLP